MAEVGHVILQLLRHALLSAKEARCLVQELVLTLAARIKEVAGMQRTASDVRVMSLLRVLCDVVSELRVRREASLAMNAEMINALRECVKEMNSWQGAQCRVMMMVIVLCWIEEQECLSRMAAAQQALWCSQKLVRLLMELVLEKEMLMVRIGG